MTYLSYLKESYTEHRAEMKRGYGVHSVGRCVDKKQIAEVAAMVDEMRINTNNRFTSEVKSELTSIMDDKFSVAFKSSLKAAVCCASPNQFIQLEKVIRRECQRNAV